MYRKVGKRQKVYVPICGHQFGILASFRILEDHDSANTIVAKGDLSEFLCHSHSSIFCHTCAFVRSVHMRLLSISANQSRGSGSAISLENGQSIQLLIYSIVFHCMINARIMGFVGIFHHCWMASVWAGIVGGRVIDQKLRIRNSHSMIPKK